MDWIVYPRTNLPGFLNHLGSDVHIWKAGLDRPAVQVERYWEILSADERKRANKFHSEIHRSRFIVGRATLRILLGCYLSIQPQLMAFDYGPSGKPALLTEHNPDRITFNLTHSNDLALYTFTKGRDIGIDVEFIHPFAEMDEIAAKSFSKREYQLWSELPDDEKTMSFFLCWTRKEAFIKAVGDGLQFPLDKFEVTLSPGRSPRLIQVETNPDAAGHWFYADLPVIPGYASALISEGNDWRLACYSYLD